KLPSPKPRLRLELLEDRTAPAILGPQLANSPTRQPSPLVVNAGSSAGNNSPNGSGTTQPPSSVLDALRADPTVTTISWGGHDAFAKVGQWVARFDGVYGTPQQQVGILQARLAGTGINFEVSQHLGMSGVVLVQGPADLGYEKVHTAMA